MLRAIVIVPNERTKDMRSLVNIAASEAKKREGVHRDIPIKTIKFIPELGVFIAIYECEYRASGVRGLRAGRG